ncbi:MAG TPA: 50S ribosomal protein L30 [Coxiellaceae bacterium]|nr:50S ribosomal protein L30 [Coxiellaceae bacterium]
MSHAKLKLTLMKSKFGLLKGHRQCIEGLGLRRRHHTVEVIDTPANRGMINKVAYVLKVENAS